MPTPTPHRITHTNYKRANLPSFTEQTEQQFLVFSSTPITNKDTSIAYFNSVIANRHRAHIPRGNRKHYNPNFTPEIWRIIRERDRLKFNSTLPLTHDITMRLQYLNNDISDRIYEQKTQNWRSFITTLANFTRHLNPSHNQTQGSQNITWSNWCQQQHPNMQSTSKQPH